MKINFSPYIKINHFDSGWWYQPTVFTSSRRKWTARPYKNLKKLLKSEDLINTNFTLSINSDNDLEVFRVFQNMLGHKIFFNKNEIEVIEKEGFINYKIPKTKINIQWDVKGVKYLRKGFIPYYSKEYLVKEFGRKKEVTLLWRKKTFIKKEIT